IFAKHKSYKERGVSPAVAELIKEEIEWGVNNMRFYRDFQSKAFKAKLELIKFLVGCKDQNKKVVAYGAAAKGNTLLNYCGIKNDLIEAVIDLNPYKQGKYLPGSNIS